MTKDAWSSMFTNITAGLVVTIVAILYAKNQISLRYLVIGTILIALLWLLLQYRQLLLVYLVSNFSVEMIEHVIKMRVGIDNRSQFDLPAEERTRLRNRLSVCSWRKKPIVFMQIRVKHYLNWIDVLYISLIRDLSELGCDAVILIHDYPYEVGHGAKVGVPVASVDFQKDVKDMARDLQKIAGRRCKVVLGSQFLEHSHSRKFPEIFYRNFLPALVNVKELTAPAVGERADPLVLIDQLRYLVGVLTVFLLRPSPVVFLLLWEARREWWEIRREIIGPLADKTFSIVGHTIVDSTGKRLDVENHAHSINISDPDDVISAKAEVADVSTLAAMCRLLLYPQEATDWQPKSKDYLISKVGAGVKGMRDKYAIRPRV